MVTCVLRMPVTCFPLQNLELKRTVYTVWLEHTFSFSLLTLKFCCSTFSLPCARLCFSNTSFLCHMLISESLWKIKGKSSHLVIADLKQLMLTPTQPVLFQDSLKKIISFSELWQNPKGSINVIAYASMRTGYMMHSTDRKRVKENGDKNKPMDDTKSWRKHYQKVIVFFMSGYWLKFWCSSSKGNLICSKLSFVHFIY